MMLEFDPEATDRSRYPDGYWTATTDDGGWDACGRDPLTAVTNLALVLEAEITQRKDRP